MAKLANRSVIKIQKQPVAAKKGAVPKNNAEIPLTRGWTLKLKVKRGRVTGATATNRKGKRARVFRMKMAAADGGTKTCYFCREDESAKASYCHPVPCSWILE